MLGTSLVLSMVAGTVLPAIVAFVTHSKAPGIVKGQVTLLFSAATGVIVPLAQGGGAFDLKNVATTIGLSFITAEATHAGIYKNVNGGLGIKSLPVFLPNKGLTKSIVSAVLGALPSAPAAEPASVATDPAPVADATVGAPVAPAADAPAPVADAPADVPATPDPSTPAPDPAQ